MMPGMRYPRVYMMKCSMKYDKVTDAMYEDLAQWLVGKHSLEIKTLYTILIEEYLSEKYGKLNDKSHKEIVKNLLGKLIS
jgi:hypothetical protein